MDDINSLFHRQGLAQFAAESAANAVDRAAYLAASLGLLQRISAQRAARSTISQGWHRPA